MCRNDPVCHGDSAEQNCRLCVRGLLGPISLLLVFNYDSNLSMCGTFLMKYLPPLDSRGSLSTSKETYDLNLSANTLRIWSFRTPTMIFDTKKLYNLALFPSPHLQALSCEQLSFGPAGLYSQPILVLSGESDRYKSRQSYHNFGTINLNSIRTSIVPGATVQTKNFSTHQKGPNSFFYETRHKFFLQIRRKKNAKK